MTKIGPTLLATFKTYGKALQEFKKRHHLFECFVEYQHYSGKGVHIYIPADPRVAILVLPPHGELVGIPLESVSFIRELSSEEVPGYVVDAIAYDESCRNNGSDFDAVRLALFGGK